MMGLTHKVIAVLLILPILVTGQDIQYKDKDESNIWNFFFGGEYDGENAMNHRTGCPAVSCGTRKSRVVYTHWGSTECGPESTELVYTGYIGGGHFSHHGGITNPLCLPDEPEYNEELTTNGGERSNIYGAELQTNTYSPWSHSHDTDPLCAVCIAKGRSTNLMIPAKRTCPEGWIKEYEGLLMGGHHGHAGGHKSLCIDIKPQSRHGSSANEDGMLFFAVIGICGSLPCPPYDKNRELSCVVCTW